MNDFERFEWLLRLINMINDRKKGYETESEMEKHLRWSAEKLAERIFAETLTSK